MQTFILSIYDKLTNTTNKNQTDIKRNISDFCVTEGYLIKSVIQIIIFVLRSDFAKKPQLNWHL